MLERLCYSKNYDQNLILLSPPPNPLLKQVEIGHKDNPIAHWVLGLGFLAQG